MCFLKATTSELSLVEREPVFLKFIADKYKTTEMYVPCKDNRDLWEARCVQAITQRPMVVKIRLHYFHDYYQFI